MTKGTVNLRSKFWKAIRMGFVILSIGTFYSSLWELRARAAEYCLGTFCNNGWDCGDACFCNRVEHTCYDAASGTGPILGLLDENQ